MLIINYRRGHLTEEIKLIAYALKMSQPRITYGDSINTYEH